jgi:glycosyltransferase involved in cell wall biosynthesis
MTPAVPRILMPDARRRVLHLIDTGGPGGAETIFYQLVTGLERLGWDSVAVVPVEDWLATALRKAGFSPELVTSHRSFDLRYLWAIRRLAAKAAVDLVQTHLLTTAVYASVACRGTRLPVVSTLHGMVDLHPHQGANRLKLRMLGSGRNRLVFVSEPLRSYFASVGPRLDAERTHVIPNGIDCEAFAPGRADGIRAELGLEAGTTLIGAVGNIRPAKAYDDLLRAFAAFRSRLPQARLVIVGQPAQGLYDELLHLRHSLDLDEVVRFLGFREDVSSILRALDLFVLSSSAEGFSLATAQAMATGLPVVVTRSGGPETIVDDGVTGRLVPPKDPEALADAMVDVLTSPDDAARMGIAGRERILRDFSLEGMVKRYADLYRRALGGA